MMNRKEPDHEGYNKALRREAINTLNQDNILKQERQAKIYNLKKQYNIPPKQIATRDEVLELLTHVLETGDNAKTTIETIAKKNNKDEQWIKDISESRDKDILDDCLKELDDEDNEELSLIGRMKKHGTYSKREIKSKKLGVALNKVRKQRQLYLTIESLKQEIIVLKEALKVRSILTDWKPEAIRLRKEGLSYGKIEKRLGVPRSTLSSYLSNIKTLI